jgi:MFS family permease
MSVSTTAGSGGRSKSLVLTAMIFAVAMTFIDQTIVSIAAPKIQDDLGLSSSGMPWAINAYLLSLAAPTPICIPPDHGRTYRSSGMTLSIEASGSPSIGSGAAGSTCSK